MTSTNVAASEQDRDKRRRRGALVRFGLAGVAVLGVGAAVTSAAWTDDAWFAGSASAAEVELQGSIDGSTWYDADTNGSGIAVAIPEQELAGLNQGADETVTLHLKNDGNTPLTLGSGTVTTDSGDPTSVFAGAKPATAQISAAPASELAAGATTTATLRITTPADWPADYQGKTGELTVQFTGQS
ncbi:hypothetical protein QUV83_16785 [Cellulomonas cellasea]|uniref:hypothetical protein n=1 Tax=Cellulomonas cellasea TaxID=43670 RepID=UPI0025A376B7|nr:hypothetical protein [Cellulomonas cellasea]MDM8086430.1 hypothetical protein [Cellulomonas cellasea]